MASPKELSRNSDTALANAGEKSANGVCFGLLMASLLGIIATFVYSDRYPGQNSQQAPANPQTQVSQAQLNSNPLYTPVPQAPAQ